MRPPKTLKQRPLRQPRCQLNSKELNEKRPKVSGRLQTTHNSPWRADGDTELLGSDAYLFCRRARPLFGTCEHEGLDRLHLVRFQEILEWRHPERCARAAQDDRFKL